MKNRKKRVSIISRESNSKTLDVMMLEEELLKRGCKVKVLSRLLTKEKSLKALGYAGHVIRQEAAILVSDVVVLDTYCIPVSMIPHRKGTKVIQMWHALGAIKKFGWQTVGREDGSSEKVAKLMKMHHGYDYVVSASDITAMHFCEAFRTDPEKIVKYGLPRIDYIKSITSGDRHEEMIRRILKAYPQLKNGRKTILYAPTFRRDRTVDAQKLINALDLEKYNIVVELHPLYRGRAIRLGSEFNTVIFDDFFSSTDWLAVADVIVSDYSSFVIESALAEMPLFIYAYDLDEYKTNTGLNIDFDREPIAQYIYRDVKALAEAVDAVCSCGNNTYSKTAYNYTALHAFRDRYIDIDTNNCTAALADFIESLI